MKVRSFKSLSLFVVFFALACEGGERESEGSTADTTRKNPERPWTVARTMEVLRRCSLAIAQRLVHCAIAVSTAVLFGCRESRRPYNRHGRLGVTNQLCIYLSSVGSTSSSVISSSVMYSKQSRANSRLIRDYPENWHVVYCNIK